MSDKFISSINIQKLGHKIQEIRERALFNIISKLDHGFIYDNDLAWSKEILSRLFDWFTNDPCTYQDVVLKLIKRILTSQCGDTLLKHYGRKTVVNDLRQIRSTVDTCLYGAVDEIIDIVMPGEGNICIVPPLQSDLPLSYRSHDTAINPVAVECTATSIETFVHESYQSDYEAIQSSTSNEIPSLRLLFKWQTLIGPDKDVLESLEQSLKNPSAPTVLLHSCQFFCDVILEDFPAEVFLQRPTIVQLLCDYLNTSVSIRFTNTILDSLLKLAKCIITRIYYYRDPFMHNNKSWVVSEVNTPLSFVSSNTNNLPRSSIDAEYVLQSQQLSVPHFCFLLFSTIIDYIFIKPESVRNNGKRKRSQIGINIALELFCELINLLNLSLRSNDWDKKFDFLYADVFKKFEAHLIKFADVLEHFRLESIASDSSTFDRVTYLRLLYGCGNILKHLIPVTKADLVLPREFKSALSNTLLDSVLARLFPTVHETIFLFVKEFGGRFETDSITKYNELEFICNSFTASVKFLKNTQSTQLDGLLKLATDALPSIGFHKNCSFIKNVIQLYAVLPEELLETAGDTILKLIAYSDEEIQEEVYKLCHERVVSSIGPKLNKSGTGAISSQILFLLRSEILIEICCHGVLNSNKQIKNYAEEILLLILKCKLLIPEQLWNKVINAIIPVLPLLASHAGKSSNLSRTIVNILDPDTANTLCLPLIEVVKGNLRLLYVDNYLIREEALSRLLWLLATQTNARNLLPHLNSLQDKELHTICHVPKIASINKQRSSQNFYQNNALIQVLELLGSDLVERDIRRSALTQISVMMEDTLLHGTFVEWNGVSKIVAAMKSALTENDKDYMDCIIPVVSILKNIVIHNPGVRFELSNDIDNYFYLVRGLFIFNSDIRMRQDCSTLLFLLLFSDYVLGTPKTDLSLPNIIVEKLILPFSCNTHWHTSKNSLPQLAATLLSDKWCLSSLQIHWNAQWFGGYEELLKWKTVNYATNFEFNKALCLTNNDLQALKNSSLDYCIGKFLKEVENGTSHNSVIESISKLASYMHLYSSSYTESNLFKFTWEKSFSRFLNTPPAYEEDIGLLLAIIKFLIILVPQYTSEGELCWIISILKNSSHCFPNLLQVESLTDLDFNILHMELFKLLTLCVRNEQSYLNLHKATLEECGTWLNIVQILADKVKFTKIDDNCFAYLGSLLSCLVHLTSSLGWSKCKPHSIPEEPIPSLILRLCGLLGAFFNNGSRLMGSAITRHVLLLINHLISELQYSNAKGWEMCLIGECEFEENILSMFTNLEQNRDVLLRAAVLQILSSLAVSQRGAVQLMQEIKCKPSIWNISFSVLLNHEEASIVRENAAVLLANLLSHLTWDTNHKNSLATGVHSNSSKKISPEGVCNILAEFRFYQELPKVLAAVYEMADFIPTEYKLVKSENTSNRSGHSNIYNKALLGKAKSDKSNTSTDIVRIATPSLIQKIAILVHNLYYLVEDNVITALKESGLLKMFFRLLVIPSLSIKNTKDFSLYCDILEMNTAVCTLLTKVVSDQICLGIILNTRDCLSIMLSLLNPSLYHTSHIQLVYLRNRLWSKIFGLMAALLNRGWEAGDTHSIVSSALNECGHTPFLKTLCEAISSSCSADLQQSALSSLTSLLRIDNIPNYTECASSISTILDSVRTPRTTSTAEERESNIENKQFSIPNKNFDILHNIYFGNIKYNLNKIKTVQDQSESLMAGAELCRLLLQLYNIACFKTNTNKPSKQKLIIINTLSSILCVSKEAKKFALQSDFVEAIILQFKEIYVRLSLESVDSLRRITDKKRICPIIKELGCLIGLITNFMLEEENVKSTAASCGLADLIHKVWIWCCIDRDLLMDTLKMLCTYTADCVTASQSLTLTSALAGSGPRKSPSNLSLLNELIVFITKEMDIITRTHSLGILELLFHILHNCCISTECRTAVAKTNLLQSTSRLHPVITKHQKPWEAVELIWLEFMLIYTGYTEGQISVAKTVGVLELIMLFTSSTKSNNKQVALLVLRNIAFHQSNRPRLLNSEDFIRILQTKLSNSTIEEKYIVVTIMWALMANCQRAKLIFKSAQLDLKLQECVRSITLSSEGIVEPEIIRKMYFVLGILIDNPERYN